jgi:hypothetical protein
MKKVRRIVLGVGYPLVCRASDLYESDDAVVLMKTNDHTNGTAVHLDHAKSSFRKYRLVLEEVLDPKEGG